MKYPQQTRYILRPLRRAAAALALTGLLATNAAADIRTCADDDNNRAIAERFEARWSHALRAASPDALASMYAESAVLMPPTDETLVGREPIASYLTAAEVPAQRAGYEVELVSCEMIGGALHVAAVWGLAGNRGETAAGAGTWTSGNVLRVLRPDTRGNWASAYEIWN